MTKTRTYQPVKDDGAKFKCLDCGLRGPAKDMWFIRTPSGEWDGVYHKDCVDRDWMSGATFIPDPK